MVDPDGTLDALSSLGLTSPLVTEQKISPGAQQGAAAGAPSCTPSAPDGASSGARTEVAERDPGSPVNYNLPPSGEQNSRSHN